MDSDVNSASFKIHGKLFILHCICDVIDGI